MISATFIFASHPVDEDFLRLDAQIAAAARQTTGYLGEDHWENPRTGVYANVYYWESEQGLQELMQHPDHLQAKRHQARWLKGYQVLVSQVLRQYGDGGLPHPTQRLQP